MNNWQPIETAPKDGTEVLVWTPDMYCPAIAHWHAQRKIWVAEGFLEMYALKGADTPTHWQPLPDAPQ